MTYTPQPGDWYLTRFGGWFGKIITVLQALLALAPSRYSHAGVVLYDGWTLSAQWPYPKLVHLDEIYRQNDGKPLAFVEAPPWADRDAITEAALDLGDRHYALAPYLWIGLARLGIRPAWLRRRVASDRRMICSSLADRAWMLAGVHAFNDGRLLGEVTPGDLAHIGTIHHHDTGPYQEGTL